MKKVVAILLLIFIFYENLTITSASFQGDVSSMSGLSGWSKMDDRWVYYQNGVKRVGWVKESSKWYYMDSEGIMQSGWVKINEEWFFFNNSGVMQMGWIKHRNNWNYLNQSGIMQTGWVLVNSEWYYLTNSGAMRTGWVESKGKWYYLSGSGAMAIGWKYINGTWYFFEKSGAMKTDWLLDGNKWYFLGMNGAMQTGWIEDNNKHYYLFHDGSMATNTSISTNPSDLIVKDFTTLGDSKQVILVTTNGYSTINARVRGFEKVNVSWIRLYDVDGYIGKEGFAVTKREGDLKSPRGKYTIGTAFGRYGNPGTNLPYRKITADDVWVDDSQSSFYNTWQNATGNNGRWKSAEKMDIKPYDYGFVINYNTADRLSGAGSAIFFHVATNHTAGCTGISQENVVNFLKWLDPAKNPVIIQTPETELGNF